MGNLTGSLTVQLFILISNLLCDCIQSLPMRDLCPSAIPNQNEVVTFNDLCLEFVNVERAWYTAQLDCSSKGGNLVQIQNEDIQNFIMVTLKNMKWNRNGLWIGAHDIGKEGHWEWITGEPVTWSNWEEGQPSCYFPEIKIFCAEDCAVLRYGSGGKWHDKRCNHAAFKYSYICQYNVPKTSGSDGPVSSPSSVNSSALTLTDATQELNNTDGVTELLSNTTPSTTSNTITGYTINSTDSYSENSTESYQNSTDNDREWTSVSDFTGSENSSETYKSVSSDLKTILGTKGSNSITELDYVEVETKSSLWETTHIIIGDDDTTTDYDYEDYSNLPSMKSAHTKTTESKSVSVTGAVLGSILGLCLVSLIVVLSFYIYKNRCRRGVDSWSVGFDNPNYGCQDDSDCFAERKGGSEA